MLLTGDIELELYQNEMEDTDESYMQLRQILQERIKKEDIDIIVLAADTEIPDNVTQNISNGNTLYSEEKSQKIKS